VNNLKNISVVMSVKNGEKYLKYSIESILNQSFKNFEFIIVNNNSNDKTQEILEYYRKLDNRIKILNNYNNQNLFKGRLTAIKLVKYEWFALMDADDICEYERLEKQIDFINKSKINKLAVVSTFAKYIEKNEKKIGNRIGGPTNLIEFDEIYKNNESFLVVDPSSLINKKAFFECEGYSENTEVDDIAFYYKVAEKGYIIQTIPEFLYNYRIHNSSYSINNTILQRYLTHFINFNMRSRRSKQKEISIDEFKKNHWNKLSYKMPRLILDYSLSFYRNAGYAYLEQKYFRFIFCLFASFFLSPNIIAKKLFRTFLKNKY
jgi:glycosyltransferase involved in cell wall biosynthesis